MNFYKSNLCNQFYSSLTNTLSEYKNALGILERNKHLNKKEELFLRKFTQNFSLLLFFCNILLIIIQPFDTSSWDKTSIALHVANGLFTIVLAKFSKRQRYFQAHHLFLIFIFIQNVWFFESFLRSANDFSDKGCFYIVGCYEQVLLMSLILGRLNVRYYLFNILFMSLYGYLRMTFIFGGSGVGFFIYGKIIMIFTNITITFAFRGQENSFIYKTLYKDIHHDFSIIVKNQLPHSIFIIQDQKSVFMNEMAKKHFGTGDKFKKVLQLLKKTETNSHKDGSLPSSKGSSRFEHNLDPLLISDEVFESLKDFDDISLFDLGSSLNTMDSGKFNCYIMKNWLSKKNNMLEVNVGVVEWNERPAHIIIITESILADQLTRTQKELSQREKLIASVSHDLRTPLNGMLGILDLVVEMLTQKELAELISHAKNSANLLLFLINDLLDSSQIFNGKLRLRLEVFSLKECALFIIDLLRFGARQRGLELNLISNISGRGFVKSDQGRLKQILMNLIGNALKFTEKGGVDVIIEDQYFYLSNKGLEPISLKQETAYIIRVRDSGCGISKDDLPLLFKEYSTIINDKTKKLNRGGVGLGLLISERLAQALNSNPKEQVIKVNSELGKGSEFSFPVINLESDSQKSMRIPINELSEIQNSAKEIFHTLDEVRPNRYYFFPKNEPLKSPVKRVLIVDDDQINLIVYSHYLSKWDEAVVEKCANGKQAIDLIMANAKINLFFDLILMDNRMPVMNGIETTKEIKRLIGEEVIPYVPVVAVSGDTDIEEFLQAGAVDHLMKPFSKNQLFSLISNLFDKNW